MSRANSLRILVTGSTGSVGRELTKALSTQGVRYRALVRPGKASNALSTMEGAKIVTGDFNDEQSVANADRMNGWVSKTAWRLYQTFSCAKAVSCDLAQAVRQLHPRRQSVLCCR